MFSLVRLLGGTSRHFDLARTLTLGTRKVKVALGLYQAEVQVEARILSNGMEKLLEFLHPLTVFTAAMVQCWRPGPEKGII